MNTPRLETERLILRKFTLDDLQALYLILSDEEINIYLPWYPVKSIEETKIFFKKRYATAYQQPIGYNYAICRKEDDVVIGYININMDDSHDFGYGLQKAYWHQGLVSEACRAVIERLKRDGIAYITATHDVNNYRSANVMKRLGMQYQYSYQEQWQPKDIKVTFRMYQLNLDGDEKRVYKKYWEMYPQHFIETGLE